MSLAGRRAGLILCSIKPEKCLVFIGRIFPARLYYTIIPDFLLLSADAGRGRDAKILLCSGRRAHQGGAGFLPSFTCAGAALHSTDEGDTGGTWCTMGVSCPYATGRTERNATTFFAVVRSAPSIKSGLVLCGILGVVSQININGDYLHIPPLNHSMLFRI